MVGDDVVGYAMEICDRIVHAGHEKLGIPTLKLVPVTSFSRILWLMTGTIDRECGTTTNTRIRQQ